MNFVLLAVLLASVYSTLPMSVSGASDVVEGQHLTLRCHFSPTVISSNTAYYWIRTNHQSLEKDFDNAALGNDSMDSRYTVELDPSEGNYDLFISRAIYNLDNAKFQCLLREKGSGLKVFSQDFDVTVLSFPGEPQITVSSLVATEGKSFALTCSSQGGSPDPQVQWNREGVPQPGQLQKGGFRDKPTFRVLEFIPKMEDDGASYSCTVWNRAIREDMRMETNVTLTVHYSPRLTVGIFNPLEVLADSDITLTCGIQANPPVNSVQWMKNEITLSNTPELILQGITVKDSGVYTCIAENGVGKASQVNLYLVVLYGPQINVVSEQEVVAGHSISVKCNVAANPPPVSVHWEKEDDPYFGQNGDTLTLEKISAEEAGFYSCLAYNILQPSGSLLQQEMTGKASVTIYVRHKPGMTEIRPTDPVAISGSLFTLSCSAQPPGWPLSDFRWWYEGQDNTIELTRGANYSIISAHVSQEGRYTCQPQNELGDGNLASVYLTVVESSTISIHLRPEIIKKEGEENFSLTCRGRGKPTPEVRWLHKQEPVVVDSHESRHSVIVTNNFESNNEYSVQSTLNFNGAAREGKSLDISDRGQYSCVFDNGVGDSAVSRTVVHIENSPVAEHIYNRFPFDVGETAVLVCKMQAYPEPKFKWLFQSKSLENQEAYQINVKSLSDDIFGGELIIRNTTMRDYGDYTCEASNQIGGNAKTILKLVKKGVPDAPTDVLPVNVSSETVTLQWIHNSNGGYAVTEFLVNALDTSNGQGRNYSCSSTLNVCQITGLTSNTVYKFKVEAVNNKGHSGFSEEITVSSTEEQAFPKEVRSHFEKESQQSFFNENLVIIIPVLVLLGVTSIVVVVVCFCWYGKGQENKKSEIQVPSARPSIRSNRFENVELENQVNGNEDATGLAINMAGLPNSHLVNNVHNEISYGGEHDFIYRESDFWFKMYTQRPFPLTTSISHEVYDSGLSSEYFLSCDFQSWTDGTESKKRLYSSCPYVSGLHDTNEEIGHQASYNERGHQASYNERGYQASYDEILHQASYDEISQQASYDEILQQASYDEILQQASYDERGQQASYDETGQQASYDEIGQQASYDEIGHLSSYDESLQSCPSNRRSKRIILEPIVC